MRRPLVVFYFVAAVASMGASYRTTNFVVEAPTPQIAQQVGQYAEHYRKEKAQQWLGQEMPPWPEPCPIRVTVTMGGAGGATSFAFDRGRVLGQDMHIEGSVERLLNSVLPHEVTHTVFAYNFRTPVPRWADEGGAVLSEDDIERNRHDKLVRQILNTQGRAIPLRRLFALKDYPSDVMALYAEGYSVSNYLVGMNGRPAFLAFVGQGMREGWDRAAQAHYHFNSVEELEQAWLQHLRDTRQQPARLASSQQPAGVDPASHVLVRQTVPPAQPLDEAPRPVYRGKAGDEELSQEATRWDRPARPGYLPEYRSPAAPPAGLQDRWQPPAPPAVSAGAVRLGAPEFPPPAQLGQPGPGTVSPVGYPR
jgi:hypothetical protein